MDANKERGERESERERERESGWLSPLTQQPNVNSWLMNAI